MRYVVCRNAQLLQEFKRLESDDKTGIIALESELDSALCILDYRLSRTTDYIAHTIYKYRISLLQRKVEKTRKTFTTSVSSPVPVSSNKYASLVVEDVDTQYTTDCVDTTAPFVSFSSTVPSTGVPRSGLAPDVKRVCLIPMYLLMDKNSLLWHLVIQKVLPMIWKLVSWLS